MKKTLLLILSALILLPAFSAGPAKIYKADIIIYGGTSAAVATAVQAKRMGKSVIVVSPDKHLGGMTSSGLGFTDTGNKEVIGGIAREFYQLLYKHYMEPESWKWQKQSEYGNKGQGNPAIDGENRTMWIFEPHAAEQAFEKLINDNNVSVLRDEWLDRDKGVTKKNGSIISIKTLSGKVFFGKVFIDATYEGDLMAAADVKYTVGREANSVYNEQWNGVQKAARHHGHYFKANISPYKIQGDPSSGLLPRISPDYPGEDGTGDDKIQAYCFRLCLTKVNENKIPVSKPEGYDTLQYELLARLSEANWDEFFGKYDPVPNAKTDVNNHGPVSFDNIGMNWDYPEASYERRKQIIKEHELYQRGILYFMATFPRVPEKVRKTMNEWGFAKDEFADNNYWPYNIYVRESRRMLGDYVMTENDVLGKRDVPHSIGMGSYTMDSHNVQRYITKEGFVQNEGDIGVAAKEPYKIDLGSIMPKKEECSNLIVPVCVSGSHIAYGSIRMEPVFMILGQSAGTIASLAIDKNKNIHDLSYQEIKARLIKDGQVLEYGMSVNSRPAIIKLWQNGIPGSIKNDTYVEKETMANGIPSRYSNVTDPTLTVFLPPADRATGTAVLICPGGGYGVLAFDHEGYQIARWLNDNGIAGIILKYRLPSDLVMKDKRIGPLQDAQEGIRFIRRHAQEWKIDPRKVGVIGFSAGGHLASTLSTHYAEKVYDSDTTSARPDFSLLIYPVITFDASFTHMGSRNNLIGNNPTEEDIRHFSNELQINEKTPPAFLVHSADDRTVPVKNSIEYNNNLVKFSIPSELHVFQKGGHGYGLSVGRGTQAAWPELCINWLKANGL